MPWPIIVSIGRRAVGHRPLDLFLGAAAGGRRTQAVFFLILGLVLLVVSAAWPGAAGAGRPAAAGGCARGPGAGARA